MKIGIIGGSGLYEMEGLTGLAEVTVETPFGPPSDRLVTGTLHGKEVVFLPRHGLGHRLLPTEVPYRANIFALKQLGVSHVLSVSAVGSLKEEIAPGHLVFPDQFIDRTRLRPSTFFGGGIVAHIQLGDPVCPHLRAQLAAAAAALDITHHTDGTYVCMEGPAFSTRAESFLYRSWGGAVIGMTNIQEARLAREAELCFATIALATDYDCWHETEAEVSVESVLKVMQENIVRSKHLLARAVELLDPERHCTCQEALRFAILTQPDRIPAEVKRDLAPIIGKYVS